MAAWRWNPGASPALCLEANPFDLCYWCSACVGWGACVLKDDLDHSRTRPRRTARVKELSRDESVRTSISLPIFYLVTEDARQ